MLNLIWFEFKKMFLKKSTFFLLLLICSFSFLAISPSLQADILNHTTDGAEYSDQMELLEGKELANYKKEIQKEYAGVMDEAWVNRIHEDHQKEGIKMNMFNVDEAVMQAYYGNDWENKFKADPEAYDTLTKEQENDGRQLEEGKLPFYVKEHQATARYGVLNKIILDTDPVINKAWINPQKEEWTNQNNQSMTNWEHIPGNVAESPERLKLFQDKMNHISQFYYDEASGWDTLLSNISEARFLLALLVIFITSRSINADHGSHTMDIIKTTKFGKFKIIFAKMIAILLTCCFVTLAYTAVFTIVNYVMFGFGNWHANAISIHGYLTPYTYQQAFLGGVGLLLCGSITIGFISAGLSAFFKKSYVTFALGLLAYILPVALPKEIVKLFPVNYMDFSGIYFYSEIMEFMNHYIFTPTFIYGITVAVVLLCCIIIIPQYRSYAMTKE